MDEHESLEAYPRVTEPFIVHCSVNEEDVVGMVVVQHPETGERRIVLECAETMTDVPEDIFGALATGQLSGRVLLTPQTARMFAARLLDAADIAEGSEFTTGTDWDASFIGELGTGND